MRAVAAVVMTVGLVLMSAPLVLPRLGVTVGLPPVKAPGGLAPSDGGFGGLSGVGAALSEGFGSVAGFLGGSTPSGTGPAMPLTPDQVTSQFNGVCAELAKSGQGCAAGTAGGGMPVDPAAMAAEMQRAATAMVDVERAPARRSSPGAKFVKVAPKGTASAP